MSTLVAAPLAAGAVLAGRYRIVRTLGVGAWGRVYLATDTADVAAPQVAIKEMHGDDSAAPDEQAEAIAWFKREVSTLLSLAHPGIPRVHGYWTAAGDRGPFYLAMDYVPGETLEEMLAAHGSPLPWREVAEIGVALCDVLAYLHGCTPPFIFRDMKLTNVIVDERTDQPVLIDFGIARQLGPSGGTAIGTDGYAPREQYMGRAETRSDLYALGATLHALLTGRRPNRAYTSLLRQGKAVEEALHAVFPPAHTLTGDVPPALSAVIVRATAFAPEDRFAAAAEMRDALHAAIDDRPVAATVIPRPPAAPAAAASAAVAPAAAAAPPTDPSLWSHVTPGPQTPSLQDERTAIVGAIGSFALVGLIGAGLVVGLAGPLLAFLFTSAPLSTPVSPLTGSPFAAMAAATLQMGGVARGIGVISIVLGFVCLVARMRAGPSLLVGGILFLLTPSLMAFLLSAFS